MGKKVLITGGAGFIGSHAADELLRSGHAVRILDNLSPQVHGPGPQRPEYLSPDAELVIGDVRDRTAVKKALRGIDAVVHLASMVGVGQSMYEIESYTSVNSLGTAVLLQSIIARPAGSVGRLVVASSMSIYGEGLYKDSNGWTGTVPDRGIEQLRAGDWELRGPEGERLRPVPTPEHKAPSLASIYALSKYHQEKMCLIFGKAYNIPVIALRFFNCFGTRQALSNPYTGVLAIFAARILNGNSPLIFEDGLQKRDFVSVYDAARAIRLSVEAGGDESAAVNIGSGKCHTVLSIAERMIKLLGRNGLRPAITKKYRVGDIRHCFADISFAGKFLNYEPRVNIDSGLKELAAWLEKQKPEDRVMAAAAELAARRLTV